MDNRAVPKKGILVVSFGTSFTDIRKRTIEACENRICSAFPGFEIRRAFTSEIIRKILKERDGLVIDNTVLALEKMKEEKLSQVIVQPLHIIPGEEFHTKVLAPVRAFQGAFDKLVVGRPLLTTIEDYRIAIMALDKQLPQLGDDEAVVMMGHGSAHPANACYSCLQQMLAESRPNIFIATVEGYPQLENVIPKLKCTKIKKVTLMAYMLVAGDHALNDMAGSNEDSWKSILEKEGFEVKIDLRGLGENPACQDIYIEHIKDCLKEG